MIGLCSLLCLASCAGNGSNGYSNHLADETSPYLLQHAYNPVDWYPWGAEALGKAQNEDKLMIISIGYAACHWCHVMERETFEDPEIAAFMNQHFVSIKVDREERPDIDQIYMSAVQLVTGNGGWPLHAFALPDGRPFYGGTYYDRDEWLNLLHQLIELRAEGPDRLSASADHIGDGIRSSELITLKSGPATFDQTGYRALFDSCIGRLDRGYGGLDRPEKFPLPSVWAFLAQHHYLTGREEAIHEVHRTLEAMAYGGIFDQVGGGFSRYTTDRGWKIPHFEKMLYDNAQLVSLYADAYRISGHPLYREVVERTLDFTERELSRAGGGFYASLDAESEGEEGRYYVWSMDECRSLLSRPDLDLAVAWYNLSEQGNWENGNNILYRTATDTAVACSRGVSVEELYRRISGIRTRLLDRRRARQGPGVDTKVLTSWNALMISGYVAAYRALGREAYLERSVSAADFILAELGSPDGGLWRNTGKGKSRVAGFLDDYAYMIQALIQLYQVTFEERWLDEAERLCNYTERYFSDPGSYMFFYNSSLDEALITRRVETVDHVMPASNSVMAQNLYVLGSLLDRKEWRDRSVQMLKNVQGSVAADPVFYPQWAVLWGWLAYGHYEIAILGPDALKIRRDMDRCYYPGMFFLGGRREGRLPLLENKLQPGRTMIYVCRDRVCRLPVDDPDQALAQVR